MMTKNDYIPMVEQVLTAMGLSLEEVRTPNPCDWRLKRGTANVVVMLNDIENYRGNVVPVLVILSALMPVPTHPRAQAAVNQWMLTTHHGFIGERFTIQDGTICLASAREAEGLQPEEIFAMLDAVSRCADWADEQLAAIAAQASGDAPDKR